MSKVIMKLINGNVRKLFLDIEKKSIKLIETKSHRAFNESCFNIYICLDDRHIQCIHSKYKIQEYKTI